MKKHVKMNLIFSNIVHNVLSIIQFKQKKANVRSMGCNKMVKLFSPPTCILMKLLHYVNPL